MSPDPTTTRQALAAAKELIKHQSVLTLATSGADGPWSAPVYYVHADGDFFFFSSPQSRHISQAGQSGQAAASIFCPSDAWQTIQGIQMAGSITQVHSPMVSMNLIARYLNRFTFVRPFFPDGQAPTLDAFYAMFRARLFAFRPTAVFYLDNRCGFGSRVAIDWHAGRQKL